MNARFVSRMLDLLNETPSTDSDHAGEETAR